MYHEGRGVAQNNTEAAHWYFEAAQQGNFNAQFNLELMYRNGEGVYPRLPNSEEGWRALSQAPFVTDVLKTPIIAVASPGCCNQHSGLRSTIRWEGASDVSTTIDTHLGFCVTNPLNTRLFTMTRFVSQIDLVLAMYELCGWFSVFEPAPAL